MGTIIVGLLSVGVIIWSFYIVGRRIYKVIKPDCGDGCSCCCSCKKQKEIK